MFYGRMSVPSSSDYPLHSVVGQLRLSVYANFGLLTVHGKTHYYSC